jgi:hypothetical protein
MPVLSLENSNKNVEDVRIIKDEWSSYFTGGVQSITGHNRYKYSNDSLKARLFYRFSIPKKVSTVKLNSFSFTRNKNKDTIPYALYYRGISADSCKGYIITDVDSLPFYLNEEEKKQFKGAVSIIIECSEIYVKINNIYISYDIEIDDEHIIKNNIKYKRRLYFDCRPKF